MNMSLIKSLAFRGLMIFIDFFTDPIRSFCLLKFTQLAGGSHLITRAMNMITAFKLREFCRFYRDSGQSGIQGHFKMMSAERDCKF